MRLHSGPLKALLKAEATMLDKAGVIPKAPQGPLGGKSMTELLEAGTVKFNVDPKYPQAMGINSIVHHMSVFGNSRWEILLNFQDPPLLMLQIFRSVVDDPVARAAPAPADIIDRPSSIVAPNLRTTIPLNRNGDVNQQPLRRPGGSSRSLCSAQPRPMRLGLPAHPPRARVRAATHVNAARF